VLTSLVVMVGYRCNLRCSYCFNETHEDSVGYQQKHASGGRDVAWGREVIARVVEEAAATGYRRLVLTGGEPLLYPETLDWIELGASAGLRVNLITNLTAVDTHVVRALSKAGARASLRVSVGGYDRSTHQRYRQGWDAMRRGLSLVKPVGNELHFSLVLTRSMLAHLTRYEAFALAEGARPHIAALSPGRPGVVPATELLAEASRAEWEEAEKSVTDALLRRELSLLKGMYLASLRPRTCSMRTKAHVLLPNGDLVGCFHRLDLDYGNVLAGNLGCLLKGVNIDRALPADCIGEHCFTNHYD